MKAAWQGGHWVRRLLSGAALLLAVLLPLAGLSAYAVHSQAQPVLPGVSLFQQLEFSVSAGDTRQDLGCWHNPGTGEYTVFLPACAGGQVTISAPRGLSLSLDGQPAAGAFGVSGPDVQYAALAETEDGRQEAGTLRILSSANLPSLYIDTESGSLDALYADIDHKETGRMLMADGDGNRIYNGGLNFIKTRGNATWSLDKKSFALRTTQAADLLGTGADQRWLLVANQGLGTNLRSQLAHAAAVQAGLEYSCQSALVDLYANGQYQGMYQLIEKIDVGEYRVDITDLEAATQAVNEDPLDSYLKIDSGTSMGRLIPNNPQDITGGYIFEVEFDFRWPSEPGGFSLKSGICFNIKAPADPSKAQADWLQSRLQQVEDALFAEDGINPATGKHYSEYIDVDSWAKYYLMDEVFQRLDSGMASTYFYKDSDAVDARIYAGPVWDLNPSMTSSYGNTHLYARHSERIYYLSSHWYPALYQHRDFRDRVRFYYLNTFAPLGRQLVESGIDELAAWCHAAQWMDHVRWHSDGADAADAPSAPGYTASAYGQPDADYSTPDESDAAAKAWLAERLDFLDSYWIDQETYYVVHASFNAKGNFFDKYYYLQHGDVLDDPVLWQVVEDGDWAWLHAGSDAPVDLAAPITEDTDIWLYKLGT